MAPVSTTRACGGHAPARPSAVATRTGLDSQRARCLASAHVLSSRLGSRANQIQSIDRVDTQPGPGLVSRAPPRTSSGGVIRPDIGFEENLRLRRSESHQASPSRSRPRRQAASTLCLHELRRGEESIDPAAASRCIARALFAHQGRFVAQPLARLLEGSFRHGFRHCIIASCMRRIASAIF